LILWRLIKETTLLKKKPITINGVMKSGVHLGLALSALLSEFVENQTDRSNHERTVCIYGTEGCETVEEALRLCKIWILRRVALVTIEVSEEHITSIIRMRRIGEL
jgi:hypothetical protein